MAGGSAHSLRSGAFLEDGLALLDGMTGGMGLGWFRLRSGHG